jgi:hypothetical protein
VKTGTKSVDYLWAPCAVLNLACVFVLWTVFPILGVSVVLLVQLRLFAKRLTVAEIVGHLEGTCQFVVVMSKGKGKLDEMILKIFEDDAFHIQFSYSFQDAFLQYQGSCSLRNKDYHFILHHSIFKVCS